MIFLWIGQSLTKKKQITNTSRIPTLSKNEISFSREAWRNFLKAYYFLRKRLRHTLYSGLRPAHRAEVGLLFDVQERRDTHAALHFGRRIEQRWPYYFLCRRPPDTRDHGLRPARRAEVTLLFLVQEAARHMGSWTWPVRKAEVALLFPVQEAPVTRDPGARPALRAEVASLFLVQEAARHTRDWTSAGA